MHDIIHWLAVHLVETPQTVQKLDQAFRSIEQGNKFECMYALTEPIDNLEAQGTVLPDQYQEIVDQVCQEAINLLDNSLKQSKKRSTKKSKKQVGGDPFSVFGWPVVESGLFVGGISFAVLLTIYGLVKWYQRRRPGKTDPHVPSFAPQNQQYNPVRDDITAQVGERGHTRAQVTPADMAKAHNFDYLYTPPVVTGSSNIPVRVAEAQPRQPRQVIVDAYGNKLSPEEINRQMSTQSHLGYLTGFS